MAHRRIHNKGGWEHEEYVSAGVITPGMLIELTVAGTVKAHAEEGGRCERLVALEDALQGRAVATNYAAAEVVTCALPYKGTTMNMLIAVGQNVGIGDELVSNGAGSLQKRGMGSSGVTEHEVVGICVEAKDNSAGAAPALAAVRVK